MISICKRKESLAQAAQAVCVKKRAQMLELTKPALLPAVHTAPKPFVRVGFPFARMGGGCGMLL